VTKLTLCSKFNPDEDDTVDFVFQLLSHTVTTKDLQEIANQQQATAVINQGDDRKNMHS
jgi:hypothetical protein